MKKFFIMAVMAVCSLAASAQTPAPGFSIAPKVGVNISTIDGADHNKTKVGFAIGAEALYMFNDMMGISGGVMYSQQGSKQEALGITATYKADYINVPIMLNEYVYPGLAIKLGIQPGFKVNEEIKFEKGGNGISGTREDLESLDISIPIGISYEFSKIVLDARYNWGVSNIAKEDGKKGHNSVFQVTLGYRF